MNPRILEVKAVKEVKATIREVEFTASFRKHLGSTATQFWLSNDKATLMQYNWHSKCSFVSSTLFSTTEPKIVSKKKFMNSKERPRYLFIEHRNKLQVLAMSVISNFSSDEVKDAESKYLSIELFNLDGTSDIKFAPLFLGAWLTEFALGKLPIVHFPDLERLKLAFILPIEETMRESTCESHIAIFQQEGNELKKNIISQALPIEAWDAALLVLSKNRFLACQATSGVGRHVIDCEKLFLWDTNHSEGLISLSSPMRASIQINTIFSEYDCDARKLPIIELFPNHILILRPSKKDNSFSVSAQLWDIADLKNPKKLKTKHFSLENVGYQQGNSNKDFFDQIFCCERLDDKGNILFKVKDALWLYNMELDKPIQILKDARLFEDTQLDIDHFKKDALYLAGCSEGNAIILEKFRFFIVNVFESTAYQKWLQHLKDTQPALQKWDAILIETPILPKVLTHIVSDYLYSYDPDSSVSGAKPGKSAV